MKTVTGYLFSAIFSLLAISSELNAETPQSLVGLWHNSDTRLASIETEVFRLHCSDGRLVWLLRHETKSITEWEIYTGNWDVEQNALTYEIRLFERAQAPSFVISKRTNLRSSFKMVVGRVDSDSFEFERQWVFRPRTNVARRVDAVQLPRTLHNKTSCDQKTS